MIIPEISPERAMQPASTLQGLCLYPGLAPRALLLDPFRVSITILFKRHSVHIAVQSLYYAGLNRPECTVNKSLQTVPKCSAGHPDSQSQQRPTRKFV